MGTYSGNYRMATDIYAEGPKVDSRTGVVRLRNRGVARAMRSLRREEAEARNALTPHMRRKAHRLNRCDGTCRQTITPVVKSRKRTRAHH